jgi:tetratricopeptide (TPR) repeat protein
MRSARTATGRALGAALCLGTLAAGGASAADRAPQWVEVRAPHFTIFSDAGAKQARQVAWQFEDVRELFHLLWPWARLDPSRPILILAVKDESGLKTLLPEYWEKKGSAHPAGVFVRGEDHHYIALRTDLADEFQSWQENPYHVVYHEYVHLILDLNFSRLPTWLNEGLAEFWGGTIVGRGEIHQGKPLRSAIYLLRQRALIPMDRLLAIDYRSPEYNEHSRASVFYAQSWALIHYFMLADEGAHRQTFGKYLLQLKGDGADEQAARQAMGDLAKLQRDLDSYLRRFVFNYVTIKQASQAARAEMPSREVAEPETLALRGEFHLARGRLQAARPLLEQAIERAPDLARAHASLGRLELWEGKREEARREVARAVELDSTNFLIHYLHAILNMGPADPPEAMAGVEQSLQRSAELNHDFAPAYALLAEVSAYRSGDYARALGLARRAVGLEPGVVHHRLSLGRLLAAMGKREEAKLEGDRALEAARSEMDRQAVQSFLANLATTPPPPVDSAPPTQEAPAEPEDGGAPRPTRPNARVSGGLRTATTRGTIVSMTCRPSGELIFVVETSAGRLTLHAQAADRVFLRKGGAMVQLDWTCGPLRIPVTAWYLPSKGSGAGGDGTVVSFDLDPPR